MQFAKVKIKIELRNNYIYVIEILKNYKNNFKKRGEIINFKNTWIYSCWYGISDPYSNKGLT